MQLLKNIFLTISLTISGLFIAGCGEADYSLEQVQRLIGAVTLVDGTIEFTTPEIVVVDDGQQNVTTIDINTNENVTYSIIGGSAGNILVIDARTGALSFIENPEYVEGESNLYEVVVAVTSASNVISTHTMLVEVVEDISLVAPLVDYVADNVQAVASTGVITQIEARPADTASNVSYSIEGQDADAFEIDENGNLSFKEPLPSFEENEGREYELVVIVTDGYGNKVSTPVIIVVLVNSLDEIRPIVKTSQVTIIENSLGAVSIRVSNEGNGIVTSYILAGADADAFDLSDSGVLSFKEARDYEELPRIFNITVQAQDHLGNMSDVKEITVNVSDMDEGFTFEGIRDYTPIVGDREIGQISVVANTISSGDVTYILVQGSDFAEIDEVGKISFKTEAIETQNFMVQVSAESQINGSLTLSEPFNVKVVLDANSIVPLITFDYVQNSDVRAPINVDSVITTINAAAQGNSTTIRYETSGVDADKFRVDASGQLYFTDAFDYNNPSDADANNVYEVVIKVIDNNGNSAVTTPIKVRLLEDLTKIAPVITSSTFSVTENQRGNLEILYTTSGTGVVESFSIVGGEDSDLFANVGGKLQFKAAQDYETPRSSRSTNSYRVEVQVQDNFGNESSAKELVVNVINVNETLNINGLSTYSHTEGLTVVGSVSAVVKVSMATTITYSIGQGSSLFSINSSTGLIMFKSAPSFNLNANNTYTFTVIAQSQYKGSRTESSVMRVNVISSSSAITFDSEQSSLAMNQNSDISFPMTATSAAGASLTYSVENVSAAGVFSINATSGELTIEAPAYSFSGTNVYTAEVVARDTSGHSGRRLGTLTINAINGVPSFTSHSSALVNENEKFVVSISASSPISEALTFTISGGADRALFDIIARKLYFKAAPNYESPDDLNRDNLYEVILSARDRYGNIATQTMRITVRDVADTVDPTPTFTSSATALVNENITTVGTLSATSPVSATLSYAITGGVDSSRFNLSGRTLSFSSAPDFEAPIDSNSDNVYEVIVTVSDANSNSATQTMRITVRDVSDTTPSFTSSVTALVNENTTTIGTLSATSPIGATLSYTITGGEDSTKFGISGTALSFNTAPDFEVPTDNGGNNVYKVIVTVTDANGDSAMQTIVVTVTDVEETPSFTSSATISVNENTTTVTTLNATSPIGAALSYTITGGADDSKFGISGTALSFNTAPDFEAPTDNGGNNVYNVIVTASDANGNSATQTMVVTVKNISDTLPSFTSSATRSSSENFTLVGALSATSPVGGILTYAVTGGADGSKFSISSFNLSFIDAPDFEVPGDSDVNNDYEVIVTATDANGNSVTQAMVVTVTNSSESLLGLGYSSFGYKAESCFPILGCSDGYNESATDTLKDDETYTMELKTDSTGTITYSLVSPAPASVFSLSGNILTIKTPRVSGFGSKVVGTVTVHAVNEDGNSANMNLSIRAK